MVVYYILIILIIAFLIFLLRTFFNNKEKREFIKTLAETLNLNINKNKVYGKKNNLDIEISLETKLSNSRANKYFDLTKFNKLSDNILVIRIHPLDPGLMKLDLDVIHNSNIVFKTDNYNFDIGLKINTNFERNIAARLNKEIRSIIKKSNENSIAFQLKNNVLESQINITDMKNIFEHVYDLMEIMKEMFGPKNINRELIYNIQREEDQKIRIQNMRLLLGINETFEPIKLYPEVITNYKDFFIECLDDPVLEIKAMAIYALKDESRYTLFYDLLEKNKNVILAINLLKDHWKEKIFKAHLYKLLNTTDTNILNCLLNIFIKTEDKESINHILSYYGENELLNSDEKLTKILLNYYGNLKINKTIPWIIKLLNSNNFYVMECIETIIKIDDIKAVEHLILFTKKTKNRQIKNIVQKAIQKLQKNIPQQNKGDLTLSEIENTGNLSLQNTQDGKLSSIETE